MVRKIRGGGVNYASKYGNTRRKTEELSFEFRPEQRIFLYSKAFRPLPDLSQCCMQFALLAFSPGLR
jgi:hypothetical protein